MGDPPWAAAPGYGRSPRWGLETGFRFLEFALSGDPGKAVGGCFVDDGCGQPSLGLAVCGFVAWSLWLFEVGRAA
jgi:hypothetical protein